MYINKTLGLICSLGRYYSVSGLDCNSNPEAGIVKAEDLCCVRRPLIRLDFPACRQAGCYFFINGKSTERKA